jgi:hypothetical protein
VPAISHAAVNVAAPPIATTATTDDTPSTNVPAMARR